MLVLASTGSLSQQHYSFMGAIRNPRRLLEESGPEVARRLLDEAVDVVLLTPTWPLCTHTVCVLARVFEAANLSTIGIAMVREHAVKVRPPRMLFVPFPFGYALGKPNDRQLQHRVLAATFDLLAQLSGPVLVDFPEEETPTDADLHAWFWGETALGQLLPAVAQRLGASDDPTLKAIAYGIAR